VSTSAANAPESGQPHAQSSVPRARLLVVEDEWLISSLVSDQLRELGFEVVGPASTVAEAVFLASRASIDAALVDLSLGGVLANDVLDVLAKRSIPFIFVTGYSSIPEGVHATALLLEKPFTGDELLHAIESILPGR
jgi:DNA-binding response OmpR family regulator